MASPSIKLLFELTHEVLFVKPILFSENRKGWLLITTSTILFIDMISESTIHTLEINRSINKMIVDAIYSLKSRLFFVLTSSSEVLIIPENNTTDILSCPSISFSYQPQRLMILDSHDIIMAYLPNGFACAFNILHTGGTVNFTMEPKDSKNVKVIDIVGDDTKIASLRCVDHKKYEIVISSIDQIFLQRLHNDITVFQPISSSLIHVTTSTSTSEWTPVIQLVYHKDQYSISVILSFTEETRVSTRSKKIPETHSSSSISTWIKYHTDGTELFRRMIDDKVIHTSTTKSMLWILTKTSLTAWDVRYGTCSYRSLDHFIPNGIISSLHSGGNAITISTKKNPFKLLSSSSFNKGSNKVYMVDLSIQTVGCGYLLGSIGKQDIPDETTISFDSSIPSVLEQLPKNVQDNLLLLLTDHQQQQQPPHSEKVESSSLSSSTKRKREENSSLRHLFVMDESIKMFLDLFNSSKNHMSFEKKQDWEIWNQLCKLGRVSIPSTSSNIISQAYTAKRIDVILNIAEYVIDLTEKDAIELILLAGTFDEVDILERFYQDGKELFLIEKTAQDSKKKSKLSSSKHSSKENNSNLISQQSNAIMATTTATTTMIDIVRLLCFRFLLRKTSFSSLLLADAMKSRHPSIGTLLLRIFIHIIKNEYLSTDLNHLYQLELDDHGMMHACNWLEALLDSNFSSTVMQITKYPSTRYAIKSILESVETVDESINDLESLLGIWTHISHNGGNHNLSRTTISTSRSNSIHRIQKLVF